MMRNFNLLLALLWLIATVYFFLQQPRNWLVIAVAGGFLLWNVVRWITLRPRPQPPIQYADGPPPRDEYNPEFDFHRPDRSPSGG